MKNIIYLLLLFLLSFFSSCSDDAVNVEQKKFSGITETNVLGELIGNIDDKDWLYENKTQTDTTGNSLPSIPTVFSVRPAYPNPAEKISRIKFGIPINTTMKIWIKTNSNDNPIEIINTQCSAGEYVCDLDFTEFNISSDICRVYFQVGDYPEVYGDIEVK